MMTQNGQIDTVAVLAALDVTMRNPSLLTTAFTHQSYANGRAGVEDNQRLEFLGDAVIGLLAAEALYRDDSSADEGVMTRRRSALVSGESLASIARNLDIAKYMRFSEGVHDINERTGTRTLAALLEAIFGAVWLDGGYDAVEALFERLFSAAIVSLRCIRDDDDPRGALQTLTRRLGLGEPVYEIDCVSGNGNSFVYRARVSAGRYSASAEGPGKKKAAAFAAWRLLVILRKEPRS